MAIGGHRVGWRIDPSGHRGADALVVHRVPIPTTLTEFIEAELRVVKGFAERVRAALGVVWVDRCRVATEGVPFEPVLRYFLGQGWVQMDRGRRAPDRYGGKGGV